MIIRKVFVLASLMMLICFFSACEYNWIEGDSSYSAGVQPIFDGKCVSCHAEGGSAPFSLKAGESYELIMSRGLVDANDPEGSVLLTKQHADVLYSETDKANILNWIQEGAQDN